MTTITASTRQTKYGYRPVITVTDHSATPITGKPFIQRRVIGIDFVHKTDALERAQFETKQAIETQVMP